jgi:hypothetical protein
MDDYQSPPRVFAHHVIKQMVQHMLGEDIAINYEDYLALRVVYRWCGGSWTKLGQGDIIHLQLLSKIVLAWGQMPNRLRHSERVI